MPWQAGGGTANTGNQGWNTASVLSMGSLGVGIAGMINSGSMNRKSRKFANEQTEKQRYWALQDWEAMNKYNSPAEQMARLKAAGLNPNLIYDNGTGSMMSAPIRSSESQSWRPDRVDVAPVQNGLASFYDMARADQSNKLLAAQLEKVQADTKLTGAQTLGVLTTVDWKKLGMSKTEWELTKDKSLYPFQLQAAELKNEETAANIGLIGANTLFRLDENERQELKNVSDLKTAVQVRLNLAKDRLVKDQQIAESKTRQGKMQQDITESTYRMGKIVQELELMRQSINLAEKNNVLKDWELELSKDQLRPEDPAYWKTFRGMVKRFMGKDF